MITSSIVEATQATFPPAADDAEYTCLKYKKLLTLFSNCHNLYSRANKMEEEQIIQLGKLFGKKLFSPQHYLMCFSQIESNIKDFMAEYRKLESNASITPKLHILECHTIPWIRRWKAGVGFHSEQGAESIHTTFNSLLKTYANVRNRCHKMLGIMKEHYLQNAPESIQYVPAITKRPKRSLSHP